MEISAIGLFVTDMKKMVTFYRDIIGLKTNWKGEQNASFEGGACRLIMFGRNDFEQMTAHRYSYPQGHNGTVEIAFGFPAYVDVDAEYKRLISLGVESVFPPTTMSWGERTCYVADPEGNLLEIYSSGKDTPSW
jgi:catechol 2,3-dioxygenase-like lactoylglutathione lyase family enzyme